LIKNSIDYNVKMSLEVSIIVPDRVFWKDDAQEIIFPTLTGQMGVLENHIPLLTGLDTGVMKVRQGTDWIAVAVMGGFALVNENKVTILVNEAAVSSDIDAQEAEALYLQTKSEFEKAAEGSKEKAEANIQYKKVLARFEVTKELVL